MKDPEESTMHDDVDTYFYAWTERLEGGAGQEPRLCKNVKTMDDTLHHLVRISTERSTALLVKTFIDVVLRTSNWYLDGIGGHQLDSRWMIVGMSAKKDVHVKNITLQTGQIPYPMWYEQQPEWVFI